MKRRNSGASQVKSSSDSSGVTFRVETKPVATTKIDFARYPFRHSFVPNAFSFAKVAQGRLCCANTAWEISIGTEVHG